ncbi:MAG: tetratricopeptide repeat protein [Ktedonobacterales bacterium]
MSLTEDQQRLWDRGAALVREGRLEDAQAAFDTLAEALPSSAPVWVEKSTNLRYLRRYEDALVAADHAVSLNGSSGLAWCAKGDALLGLQRYNDALFAYYKALPLQADKATTLIGVVRGLIGSKRYAEALTMIDHLEHAMPNHGLVWHYRATAYNGLERYNDALEALGKALQLGVGNLEYDAWLLQGYAYVNLGHYEEALAAYEQAIRVRPNDLMGWEGKLRVLWRARRWRALWQAVKEFMAAKPRRQRMT